MKKGIKEYRVGIGEKGAQGDYIRATSKKDAFKLAKKRYERKYGVSSSGRVLMKNVKVWRNADGSVPAWRKKRS